MICLLWIVRFFVNDWFCYNDVDSSHLYWYLCIDIFICYSVPNKQQMHQYWPGFVHCIRMFCPRECCVQRMFCPEDVLSLRTFARTSSLDLGFTVFMRPAACLVFPGAPAAIVNQCSLFTLSFPVSILYTCSQCFGSASVSWGSGSGSYLKSKCGSGFMPWQNRIGNCKGTCIKI